MPWEFFTDDESAALAHCIADPFQQTAEPFAQPGVGKLAGRDLAIDPAVIPVFFSW